MNTSSTHTTVMLHQAVNALLASDAPHKDGIASVYVDATFGRGGHSRLILSRLNRQSQLIAFDKDPDAVAAAAEVGVDPRFSIRHQGFGHLNDLPVSSVAGVLFDLGVSSPQLDNPARGFGFRANGPLDMRMDSTTGQTVAQWLAYASVNQILEVIHDYGEERFAGPIAKAIVARRQAHGPLENTTDLARLVADAVKTREPGKHPATRTFQAFRIFINAELSNLQYALEAALRVLQPGGQLVVISFHSLEDRIAKQFIARHSRTTFDRRLPQAAVQATPVMPLRALGKHRPCADEVAANPRSRSAIMRVAQRTHAAILGGQG